MKAPAILGIVEAAVGARMYEDIKEKALFAMEKKEKKIQEITHVLEQVINPKLNKLNQKRAHYFEYQSMEIELTYLKRILSTFEFKELEQRVLSLLEEKKAIQNELGDKKAAFSLLKDQLANTNAEIQRLSKRFQKSSQFVEGDK